MPRFSWGWWTHERTRDAADTLIRLGTMADAARDLSSRYGLEIIPRQVITALDKLYGTHDIYRLADAIRDNRFKLLANHATFGIGPPASVMPALASSPPAGPRQEGVGGPSHRPEKTPGPKWLEYGPEKPTATKHAKSASQSKTIRLCAIADSHTKYHDRAAWSVAQAVIKDIDPHVLVHAGDAGQWESCNQHRKSRLEPSAVARDFYDLNVFLDEMQMCAKNAKHVLLEGNHDAWIRAAAAANPGMADMLDLERGLYLKRGEYWRNDVELRGVQWIDIDHQPFKTHGIAFAHGAGYEGVHHAARIANEFAPAHDARIMCCGHNHTAQQFWGKSGHVAIDCPWLGDEAQPAVFDYARKFGKPTGWVQGVLFFEINQATRDVSWRVIRIANGRASFDGKVYRA